MRAQLSPQKAHRREGAVLFCPDIRVSPFLSLSDFARGCCPLKARVPDPPIPLPASPLCKRHETQCRGPLAAALGCLCPGGDGGHQSFTAPRELLTV